MPPLRSLLALLSTLGLAVACSDDPGGGGGMDGVDGGQVLADGGRPEPVDAEAPGDDDGGTTTEPDGGPAGCGDDCPLPVAHWQALFDEIYADPDARGGRAWCTDLASSANLEGEYHPLARCVSGLLQMWRASGEDRYLDELLRLVDLTLADAPLAADGYRRWPVEVPLYESYYWRHVATLVRVMQRHPELLDRGYRTAYEELLELTRVHIWEKWEAEGVGNFYRSRVHMASHWARISMELYLVTGEDRFLEVFENISFGEMPTRPSNIRQQLERHPEHPSAYVWSSEWGVDWRDSPQDVPHGGQVITFIVTAEDAGMYWDRADVDGLLATLNELVWPAALGGRYHRYVDGSDGGDGPYGPPWGRLNEWLELGRYDLATQRRIETDYDPDNWTWFGVLGLGAAALNAKILTDGAPAY